jgi:hypothetical protein
LGQCGRRRRIGDGDFPLGVQRDCFEAFGAHHGAGAAAAGLAAVVFDRGETNAVLAGGPDRTDAQRAFVPAPAQGLRRLACGRAEDFGGVVEHDPFAVEDQRRPLGRGAVDHQRGKAAAAQRRRPMTRRQSFVEQTRQR